MVLWVMFLTVSVVAIFFWVSFEKEREKNEKLVKHIDKLNGKTLTMRTQNMIISDLVQEYRKDVTNRNACMAMREISDLMLKNKIELDTKQSN